MIRPAAPGDVPVIGEFIRELALYERAPQMAIATDAQLRESLFGPQPAVYAHMAVADDGQPAGFALWFLNYSTWRGTHGIYLEDLFVRPAFRGAGYGTQLLAELARIAVQRGYWCVQWWVLDWNAPSIEFYRSLGAEAQDEWTVFRLHGDPLARLAHLRHEPAAQTIPGSAVPESLL